MTIIDVDREIGQRIMTVRRSAGISRAELGKHMGITAQQTGKIERGQAPITPTRLIQIGEKLRVCPSIFIKDIGDKKHRDHFAAVVSIILDTLPENQVSHLASVAELLWDMQNQSK